MKQEASCLFPSFQTGSQLFVSFLGNLSLLRGDKLYRINECNVEGLKAKEFLDTLHKKSRTIVQMDFIRLPIYQDKTMKFDISKFKNINVST